MEIHHRQPDGTVVHGVKYEGSDVAVLILPSLGESLKSSYYDKLAKTIHEEGVSVYALELRGHRLSRGKWSLHAYRADITYWIAHMKSMYKKLYVIASGMSASTMLEYDDQAHTFTQNLPPLADGMLLLAPIFNGAELLPRLDRTSRITKKVLPRMTKKLLGNSLKRKFKHIKPHDPIRMWEEIASYTLHPVRIQTPTVMLVPMDETSDPLKRVFGNVRVKRAGWLHVASSAGLAHHMKDISKAFKEVLKSEKPIRFKASL